MKIRFWEKLIIQGLSMSVEFAVCVIQTFSLFLNFLVLLGGVSKDGKVSASKM